MRAGVLPTAFAVTFLAPVALQILLKVEFNFEVIIYNTIFVSHIRKAALSMWSVVKTYLKVLRSSCCHGDCRKKNVFTRNVWVLCTPWFSVLRPPKDWFVIFLSILKPKTLEVWNPRPWKFEIWPAMRHDYLQFLRKSILIGLSIPGSSHPLLQDRPK